MFLVPLDDERHWYRYHHLFADVLRQALEKEQPDQLAALHQRASEWHEAQGDPLAAIQHAQRAGDPNHLCTGNLDGRCLDYQSGRGRVGNTEMNLRDWQCSQSCI